MLDTVKRCALIPSELLSVRRCFATAMERRSINNLHRSFAVPSLRTTEVITLEPAVEWPSTRVGYDKVVAVTHPMIDATRRSQSRERDPSRVNSIVDWYGYRRHWLCGAGLRVKLRSAEFGRTASSERVNRDCRYQHDALDHELN